MVNQNQPITPPPALVEKWYCHGLFDRGLTVATWAAQWGADQELEACCAWLPKMPPWSANDLRKHRRPKPPSLKEQALTQLTQLVVELERAGMRQQASTLEGPIRCALEALDD
jgi:hypothetical protein